LRELNGEGGFFRNFGRDVEKFRLVGAAGGAFFHLLDFVDEFAGFLELAVDGGVADVGHGIDGLEFLHGAQPDEAAGHFASGFGAELGDDFVDEAFEGFQFDRTLLAGFGKAAEEFVAVERLGPSAPLEHTEFDLFDLLVGGVAGAAGQALAATTDPLAFLNRARVDDAVAHVSATGATHSGFS
jgi:hypothetical protein